MKQRIVHNAFLAEAARMLELGKSVRIRIGGNSMYPFIQGGKDEVEIVPLDSHPSFPLWSCVFYQWNGHYMIHRYIGRNGNKYRMMGDGNLLQVEEVAVNDIKGVLNAIYRPNGTCQNCLDKRWLRKGKYWFRLRKLRRILIVLIRTFKP
jgi:hypothetical protein